MEFGVDLDQTAVDLWPEMTWNFHENPCHIFYRVDLCFVKILYYTHFVSRAKLAGDWRIPEGHGEVRAGEGKDIPGDVIDIPGDNNDIPVH